MIDGKPYSAWYDASGIRIAPGRSARYVNSAQIISWRDAARRVGELMDAGQFLSMMELANCPIHELSLIHISEMYETYFLNLVDERDLLALMSDEEKEEVPTPTPEIIYVTPEPTTVPALSLIHI